jgi:hypothetical protein
MVIHANFHGEKWQKTFVNFHLINDIHFAWDLILQKFIFLVFPIISSVLLNEFGLSFEST